MTERRGIWIDGEEKLGRSGHVMRVVNPYDDSLVGEVACASTEDLDQAISGARIAQYKVIGTLPAVRRSEILRRTAAGLRREAEPLVDTIVAEGGKPIRDARREVGRAASLFDLAADHLNTLDAGTVVPMDIVESGVNRFGYTVRVPVGVVAAIVPSNSPVNLSANKIAPALAMGNAVVLKPADQTPLSALHLARIMHEAGLPPGGLNVVIGTVDEVASPLVSDDRIRMVSVTGGVETGRAIARCAGIKKLALELGSSSANVVCEDADIAAAAKSLATSAFLSSGQACISAQRIFVHESLVREFARMLVEAAEAMVIGDPRDPATEIGPMVSRQGVDRLMDWIGEARSMGARVLTGGERYERTIRPTILADVPRTARLAGEEAFGPVATLATFCTLDDAVEQVNQSRFGLQAGVFTNDVSTMFRLAREIDVGALWVNESSRYRQDNYPFGGRKQSGVGREGVRYAMEDMSELKFIGVRLGTSAGIL